MNWQRVQPKRWLRSRWLIGGVGALAVYTLAGFLLVPALIKWQMTKRLPALTKRGITVRQVKLNPYALSLTIRGFVLTEADGTEFAGFDELYVNLQLLSIIKRGLVFAEISLKGPRAHIVRQADGQFNFANLVTNQPTASTATPPVRSPASKQLPLIVIEQLRIAGGAVNFTDLDRPTAFHHRLGPINVRLSQFTTRPKAGSPYAIVADSENGATFAWAGDFSIVPLRSAGTFKLTALPLKTYAPYLQDFARIDIRDGRLNLEAEYRLDAANDRLDLEISRASLALRELLIKSLAGGETIVAIPEFAITGVSADLVRQTAQVSAITSTGGVLQVRWNPDGTIEPLSLIKTPAPLQTGRAPQGRATSQPVAAPVRAWIPGSPPTDATPSRARLQEPQAGWKVALGTFTLRDYHLKVADERGLRPSVLTVDQLGLTVTDAALDAGSNLVTVAEVTLSGLTTALTILPARASNAVAAAAAPAPAPVTPTATPPARADGGFLVKVAAVVFTNATFRFTDQSVTPPVNTALEDFGGRVAGLSSALNTTATVDLHGQVNRSSSLAITGQINPLASDLFVDLGILLKDTRLQPSSPYTAKYVGYPLEKGALSLDLHYLVKQRELKAQNKLRVDQMQLGPESHSPDAVKLPVKLAIALLQDRHGVIALDVPVTGRLDDPKFKLGPIIMQVFLNVITKAVTKPFALLGSMFGGGEDLSFVAFEPGQAGFAAGETLKLDSLAKALYERPALNVTLTGAIDPVKDREALAKRKLEQRLKALRAQELGTASQKTPAPDTIKLDPADRERLLKLAYAEATGLVAGRASATKDATVLTHLLTKQNFSASHPAAVTAKRAAAKPGGQLTLAAMEAKLLEISAPTPADFQTLMQDRAGKTRDYLVQTGHVAADRLSIAAPPTAAAPPEGQSRVTFGLR